MRRKIFGALFAVASLCNVALADSDEHAVRHLLHTTFDKPEQKLSVEPVVVEAGYAIAGWIQGDMGGRALLQQKHGQWTLILCAGDGIKTAEGLRHAGIVPATADLLARSLAVAEQKLTKEKLAMFARFEGVVHMDEQGNHPPVHGHKH